ncbi:MAG: tRNA 2-thiouridine(34) synthase MnmA [Lachnospiraceae bacterium]|nr:tRNA 2-thiouridine(34) synthase MnmA [Lachnospiraceae bacterium]
MGKKVVIGLSGGVDSSVAAYLLKEKGYECIGVTMRTWQPENEGALENILRAEEDARMVAQHLDIPYHIVDFTKEFDSKIMKYFVDEYMEGRTPNPCTACNHHIKWNALMTVAEKFGADYVATGHYARIIELPNGRYSLMTTPTANKDQTYALFRLSQEQLAKTLMPVGEYTKDEIRDIAARIGISVANKPDSQEICFIPDNDYAGFIERYTGVEVKPGNFIDVNGNILGKHKGIIHYTVGQRKGLNIALGHPVFVVELRPETNEVVLGSNEDVFSKVLYADNVNFMGISAIDESVSGLKAKIRYAHKGAECRVTIDSDGIMKCEFEEPQRAITPGQAVVLYKDDVIAAGGTIIRAR